jgi:hypothetical protein
MGGKRKAEEEEAEREREKVNEGMKKIPDERPGRMVDGGLTSTNGPDPAVDYLKLKRSILKLH